MRLSEQFTPILGENLGRHVQSKVDTEKKINLQAVHFGNQNSSDLGVVRIVVIRIVKELGGEQYSRDDDSMHVQFRKEEIIVLNQSVNVNQC